MSLSALVQEIRIPIIDVYDDFFQRNKEKLVLCVYGGAGSGKSYAVAQYLILRALEERGKHFLITRATLPSLRLSCWMLIQHLLREYGIPHAVNKSEFWIEIRDNKLFFKSLDDPEKIKSAEFNYIWMEEATEFNYQDFLQLKLRLRRKNKLQNQIILTFNPIDAYHWLKTQLVDTPADNVAVLRTTYKENPFLSADYVQELQRLSEVDENYYRIYALGEWGILQNLIYTNWDVVDRVPEEVDQVVYGLDFGYNNPTALVEVRIKENEAWVRELIYQSHLTNQDLIDLMKGLKIGHAPVYADSSEPQRIEELYKAGFNVYPAMKSVKDGIDRVKRYKLRITKDSVNTLKEIRAYKWREDKEGQVLDEPVKFNDHAMDALRYAIASMEGRNAPRIRIL
ncbi:PBSX family phage terminase large subunit [Atrimonas thermophila]